MRVHLVLAIVAVVDLFSPVVRSQQPSSRGLLRLNKDQILERGAWMARRDDREYREYLREEQRSQPGRPARKVVLDQPRQATSPRAPEIIRLWVGQAPGAQGELDEDTPTLAVYLPPRAANATVPIAAVIIAPGGGYRSLAMDKEGRAPAEYLSSLGMAACVLTYRLGPRYHHPIQLGDAQRAIRLVRTRAREWNIAPDRVGIFGFSAGGHLASTASTQFDSGNAGAADPIDRASSRPDFAVLAYPVISLTEAWTHQGSKLNLLGEAPDPALARRLSTETQVTSATPPAFIYHTNADTGVPVENSIAYFLALRKAGVPAEIHVFKDGPHGTGLGQQDPALREWPTLLANWLRASRLLPATGGGR